MPLNGVQGCIAAGTAAGAFLPVSGMGGRIGAKEEAAVPACGGFKQRLPVFFPLEDGQAVMVRAKAAGKKRVAVEKEMVCRDGGANMPFCLGHIPGGFFGGNVLKDNFQSGQFFPQGNQDPVNKDGFPVKNVHPGVGDFPVHQKRHVEALHGFQRFHAQGNICHARVRIGGCPGRIELDSINHAAFPGFSYFIR